VTVPLLDATGAAELLGVPKSWVLDQARRDAIPHVRLGRYVRFDPEELMAWTRARTRGPSRLGSSPGGPRCVRGVQ
jgi:excisionase family DNA binding protein